MEAFSSSAGVEGVSTVSLSEKKKITVVSI
jgi:hypothetical protein